MSEPSASGAKPAATAAADPPLEPPGHARRVVRVAGRAERRVLGRRAHRELVEVGLADRRSPPAATHALDDGRVYGGRQPSRMRDEHVVGMPRVHRLSLSATGTPASGPGSSPRGDRGVDRVGGGHAPRRPSTRLNAWSSGSRASIDGEVLLDDVARRALARPATAGRDVDGRVAHGRVQDPRDPEAAVLGRGRLRRAPRRGRASARTSSGRSTFTSGSGCAVGGTSSRSSAATSSACSRIAAELVGQLLDLVVGEREPGELRDVLDVGSW